MSKHFAILIAVPLLSLLLATCGGGGSAQRSVPGSAGAHREAMPGAGAGVYRCGRRGTLIVGETCASGPVNGYGGD